MLTVRALDVDGIPAPSATCRAGAWPSPAERTLPTIASSTAAGVDARPARCASRAATTPSSTADLARQAAQVAPDRRPAGRQDQRVRLGHRPALCADAESVVRTRTGSYGRVDAGRSTPARSARAGPGP